MVKYRYSDFFRRLNWLLIGARAASPTKRRERLKELEAAGQLSSRETNLARALRLAGIGSALRDYRTGGVVWSGEVYRILGLDPGIGPDYEAFRRLVHPDDLIRVETARERAVHGLPDPPFEYRIIKADGEIRILYRKSETVFDGRSRPIIRVTIMQDLTEQRAAEARRDELERQLQHTQKLESLGTMAGGIAHELNNMLVPVIALSELACEDLPEDSPLRADLEIISSAGERGSELIQRVLAFSRKQDVAWKPLCLADVAREALRMLRPAVPATVRIDENIEDVPLIIGDFGQLHQVVVILVTNAAQAIGDESGRITVSVSCGSCLPNGGTGASMVCLAISDNGCGMDEATQRRIFEPFYTTKPVGEGTGLGLSIAYGIVQSHRGLIEVRSAPKMGSEFSVLLPVHRSVEFIALNRADSEEFQRQVS